MTSPPGGAEAADHRLLVGRQHALVLMVAGTGFQLGKPPIVEGFADEVEQDPHLI